MRIHKEQESPVAGTFALTLLKWFREHGRELPWRQTRNPYAIWLSEIILQQTQVKQGWDYWERFMHRWPTVEDLAGATEDEVLREWQGLGYYSRARNLHYAAKQIVALGHFPDTLEDIKRLKGVGDYTAAAIGSIAFGLPAAVVDGNVYRVLARHFGIDTPINTTEGKKTFAALAQELLPISPSDYSLTSHLSPLILHLSPLKINVKHVLTHRILLADFYLCEVGEKPSLPPDYIWIPETELDHYAVPRLIEKFLQDFK